MSQRSQTNTQSSPSRIALVIPVAPISTQKGTRSFVPPGTRKVVHYTDKKATAFRSQIVEESKHRAPKVPPEGPVHVDYQFFVECPKKYKGGEICAQKPDLTNLIKGVEDALTKAGFWRDDKQVVSFSAEKRYAHGDLFPRIEVTITYL